MAEGKKRVSLSLDDFLEEDVTGPAVLEVPEPDPLEAKKNPFKLKTVTEAPPSLDPAEIEERQRKAYKTLLTLTRSLPELYMTLGARKTASDHEIIQLLCSADEPRKVLREAGCSAAQSAQAAMILDDALAYEPHEQRSSCLSRYSCKCWIVVFLFFLALVMLASFLILLFLGKSQWEVGQCEIKTFHNLSYSESCLKLGELGCFFDVGITANRKWWTKERWKPALERIEGRVQYVGAPFRCCDQSKKTSCCEFLDVSQQLFCDNWPHRRDEDGKTCPEGKWQCLFKLNPDDPEEVTELQPDYDSPMMWNLLWTAIAFLLLGICLLIAKSFIRRCLQCLSKVSTKTGLMQKGEVDMLKGERKARNTVKATFKKSNPSRSVSRADLGSQEREKMDRRRLSVTFEADVEQSEPSAQLEGELEEQREDERDVPPVAFDEDRSSPTLEHPPALGPPGQNAAAVALDAAATAFGDEPATPAMTLKQLAQKANGDWQRQIIDAPTWRHGGEGLAGSRPSSASRRGSSRASRPPSASSRPPSASSRPQTVKASPKSGTYRVGSRPTSAATAYDPAHAWSWGDDGSLGIHIDDVSPSRPTSALSNLSLKTQMRQDHVWPQSVRMAAYSQRSSPTASQGTVQFLDTGQLSSTNGSLRGSPASSRPGTAHKYRRRDPIPDWPQVAR